jgi:glycosyltransferase involved in cell wall biosynthesis
MLLGRRLEGDAKVQADGASADIDKSLLPPGRGPIQQYQRVIETLFNYVFNDPGVNYTREQFGLNADDFVACAVGHRLDDEISPEFVCTAGKSAADDPSIKIVFVGAVSSKERILDMLPADIRGKCRERIVFTGPLEGASAFIKLADITMNPERSGGGRAAFEGYCFGKPSVSLRKGDAYWAGVHEFGADSWEDYTVMIEKLASDRDYYAEMSELARKRAAELSDITATQKKMLEDLGVLY